jgi:hypothetical protein
MPNKLLWRFVLIVVVCATIAAPAHAETFQTLGHEIVAGIVVVSVAIGVGIALLVLHYKHQKRTITGCVASGATGITLTDEKDKRIYTLSGDPVGVKLGDRITVEGKGKTRDKKLVFEANRMIKDFGVCPI